jgi:hypothetical protein
MPQDTTTGADSRHSTATIEQPRQELRGRYVVRMLYSEFVTFLHNRATEAVGHKYNGATLFVIVNPDK